MNDYLTAVLDDLVPDFQGERGDWARVLTDARRREAEVATRRRRRRLPRRRVVIACVAIVAVAAPLVAFAGSKSWWFRGAGPERVTDVVVVRKGAWQGRRWQVIAFRSARDGICFGMFPPGRIHRGPLACALVEGVPQPTGVEPVTPLTVTFLTGSPDAIGTPWVVGPVVDRADEVAIHLGGGTVVRTSTFASPAALGSRIRFYAAELPRPAIGDESSPGPIRKLVGYSADGEIVACLIPATLEHTPSDCR